MTLLEAITQYKDNISWRGDVAKARLFEEAALVIQLERAQGNSQGGTSLNFESVAEQIKRVQAFLDSASTTGRSVFTTGRCRR
jgi:hypothetical protein